MLLLFCETVLKIKSFFSVPNALVGEFTIDENFTDDLKDNTSEGYQSLAKYIEREVSNNLFICLELPENSL